MKKKARAWLNPELKKDLKLTALQQNKNLLDLRFEDITRMKEKKKDRFRFSL